MTLAGTRARCHTIRECDAPGDGQPTESPHRSLPVARRTPS
jgi:hypothetical protein